VLQPLTGPGSTRIYGFDLAGTSARYVGMGTVDGRVAGSWSMDEQGGVLRVAVTDSGGDGARPGTAVVTLRPEAGRLLDIGHLDGLGVGEQLKSVRWFGDLAVLVTFQQVDPFYVVDLTNPTDPRLLGSLHLPGWSSYLHPVGPHLVLGLGQDSPVVAPVPLPAPAPPAPPAPKAPTNPPKGGGQATASPVPVDPPDVASVFPAGRAKATLFDIADPAHPRALSTVRYPAGTIARAGVDPHQVTWLPDAHTLLTVVSADGWTAVSPQSGQPLARTWVSVLTVGSGSLHDRLVPVSVTAPAEAVRTLPLSDGRVVLVAGDVVRFLPV
jgi:hypothetical protein